MGRGRFLCIARRVCPTAVRVPRGQRGRLGLWFAHWSSKRHLELESVPGNASLPA